MTHVNVQVVIYTVVAIDPSRRKICCVMCVGYGTVHPEEMMTAHGMVTIICQNCFQYKQPSEVGSPMAPVRRFNEL